MAPFEASAIRSVVEATERSLGDDAWPLYTASNHDIGRLATRWAEGDEARVRCALFVLLLLRGTPVLYAGDEIGLENVPVPNEARRDPGSGPDGGGRDGGRTPMLWEPGEGRGFTDPGVRPWLPFGGEIASVAEQRADARSVLSWCRRVIQLRRERPDLARGAQRFFDAGDGVLAWQRGGRATVVANLSPAPASAVVPEGRIELASDGTRMVSAGELFLPPWGCSVLRRTGA
jgi:alpha-glucosidase